MAVDLSAPAQHVLLSGTSAAILTLGQRVDPAPDLKGEAALARRFGKAADLSMRSADSGDYDDGGSYGGGGGGGYGGGGGGDI